MGTFKIAVNKRVIARPGKKPDFASGKPYNELTGWQKFTRRELTYGMSNGEFTEREIADFINRGFTITAWHTGGENCLYQAGESDHYCDALQHRCNANFLLAQHLGADFDNLERARDVLDHPLVKEFGSIVYHTPSSTTEKPRMRVIFLLDEPVDNGEYYRVLVKAMMYKFEGKTDPACSDYCRLFYGNEGRRPYLTNNILPLRVAAEWGAEFQEHIESLRPAPVTQTFVTAANLTPDLEKRRKAFGAAILNRATQKVKEAAKGERHYALRRAGFHVGSFVAGGVLDEYEARRALEDAYQTHNPNPHEMKALLDWCFTASRLRPSGLPDDTANRLNYWDNRRYHYA